MQSFPENSQIQNSFLNEIIIRPQRLEVLVDDTVLLGEPVDAVIALSHPPDGATDGVRLGGSGHAAGGLVNLGQVDLDGSMVLSTEDPVAGAALPWNVHVHVFSSLVLHGAALEDLLF